MKTILDRELSDIFWKKGDASKTFYRRVTLYDDAHKGMLNQETGETQKFSSAYTGTEYMPQELLNLGMGSHPITHQFTIKSKKPYDLNDVIEVYKRSDRLHFEAGLIKAFRTLPPNDDGVHENAEMLEPCQRPILVSKDDVDYTITLNCRTPKFYGEVRRVIDIKNIPSILFNSKGYKSLARKHEKWLAIDSSWEQIIENVVNEFKIIPKQETISIVKGDDLVKYYHGNSYDPQENIGTLKGSCMRNANWMEHGLGRLSKETDVLKLVVVLNEKDKVIGRALLWKDNKGNMIMDRAYGSDHVRIRLRKWAKEQKFFMRKNDSAGNYSMVDYLGKDANENSALSNTYIPIPWNNTEKIKAQYGYLDTYYILSKDGLVNPRLQTDGIYGVDSFGSIRDYHNGWVSVQMGFFGVCQLSGTFIKSPQDINLKRQSPKFWTKDQFVSNTFAKLIIKLFPDQPYGLSDQVDRVNISENFITQLSKHSELRLRSVIVPNGLWSNISGRYLYFVRDDHAICSDPDMRHYSCDYLTNALVHKSTLYKCPYDNIEYCDQLEPFILALNGRKVNARNIAKYTLKEKLLKYIGGRLIGISSNGKDELFNIDHNVDLENPYLLDHLGTPKIKVTLMNKRIEDENRLNVITQNYYQENKMFTNHLKSPNSLFFMNHFETNE